MGIFDLFKRKKQPSQQQVVVPPPQTQATETMTPAPKPKVVQPIQQAHHVLLEPIVTEYSTTSGTYLFKVTPHATKNEIRKAFTAKYGKTPRKVHTINIMGRTITRGRFFGKRSDWKKAIISLPKGESIEVFQ